MVRPHVMYHRYAASPQAPQVCSLTSGTTGVQPHLMHHRYAASPQAPQVCSLTSGTTGVQPHLMHHRRILGYLSQRFIEQRFIDHRVIRDDAAAQIWNEMPMSMWMRLDLFLLLFNVNNILFLQAGLNQLPKRTSLLM
ncbi:hypothetical protein CRUP_015521 [Coryphaenoides rupestris]|nr:hypothetical protein CRUP_015521 [Coryphaenoides rupestris]